MNPAECKRNLIRWLDDVEDIGKNKVPGKYSGLRQHELLSIQNALSSVDQWAFEQQITCGLFFVTTRGRGGTTKKCILIGPFQRTF